jgi:hypothetical protein
MVRPGTVVSALCGLVTEPPSDRKLPLNGMLPFSDTETPGLVSAFPVEEAPALPGNRMVKFAQSAPTWGGPWLRVRAYQPEWLYKNSLKWIPAEVNIETVLATVHSLKSQLFQVSTVDSLAFVSAVATISAIMVLAAQLRLIQ